MLDQQSGRRVCPKGQVKHREEDLNVGLSAFAAPRRNQLRDSRSHWLRVLVGEFTLGHV